MAKVLSMTNRRVMYFLWPFLMFVATNAFKPVVNEKGILKVLAKHIHITFAHPSHLRFLDSKKIFVNDEQNELFKQFMKDAKGMKDQTFNIYDDNMIKTAIILLEIIQNLESLGYEYDKVLNLEDINKDLLDYVLDLNMLYRDKRIGEAKYTPPFIKKPNFFLNGEVIFKALSLTELHLFNKNHTHEINDNIVINANYSGWDLALRANGGEEELNYFREDISLNSYYYGIHLMHPYWLNNKALDKIYERHSEYYYFVHQQLVARSFLEKEHLKYEKTKVEARSDYNPYLIHDNGLPFPVRSNLVSGKSREIIKRIKEIDIGIKESMSKGRILLDNLNTTKLYAVKITENNYVKLLSKLIRGTYDGITTAKMIRSLLGYGGIGYPYDKYNPAPSVMHYPQTSLRDTVYWVLVTYAVLYIDDYKGTLKPYELSKYENEEIDIYTSFIPKVTTSFGYYEFNINNALHDDWVPINVTARQKRLQHNSFYFDFVVDSKRAMDAVVRLFLGPPCHRDCWRKFSFFWELDKFKFHLDQGVNLIMWSPEMSDRYSNDDFYNILSEKTASGEFNESNKFSIFKFPENLVIPRGSENGMNLTVFIMITPADPIRQKHNRPKNLYRELHKDIDNKPLGFPFHRHAIQYKYAAKNYKFYNITITHQRSKDERYGTFSPNLM